MRPSDEQIRELMTTVACAVCGANYQAGGVEVLGHRDELWFLRVSCDSCATRGLVAAMIRATDGEAAAPEAPAPDPAATRALDTPRDPSPVTRADVVRMRSFLSDFDGDFRALFAPDPEPGSHRPAA